MWFLGAGFQQLWAPDDAATLGGSGVVISGVTSRVAIIITHITGLTTPLITTHEPPSRLHPGKAIAERTWRFVVEPSART